AGLASHLWPAGAHHQGFQYLWSLPVSRKTHSAGDPEGRAGRADSDLRGWRQRAGLALCRGPLPRHPAGPGGGASGGGLQRGGQRAHQPASHRYPLWVARRVPARFALPAPRPTQGIRPRPAGTRSALRHRCGQAASRAGVGAPGAVRERAAANPDLVSGKPGLVSAGAGRQPSGRAARDRGM
ncbi:MAG: dTDP-glucose 4,6-dehydratase (EC 4.2.1.46), partial [Olavius algarvensis Gamma 1 endosymbiont]